MGGVVAPHTPNGYRTRMVEQVLRYRPGLPGRVVEAMGRVPRHVFTPGESLGVAYNPFEVAQGLQDDEGLTVSSVSAPILQARMLEQLDVHEGMRVLEVGSGGYNAALLAEIVGPRGRVVTMDLDRRVTARTRTCLDRAGYDRVIVVDGDAAYGAPDAAPFDRIIVTVAVFEVARAWLAQLAPGGRIVAPLELRATTRSVVLTPSASGMLTVEDPLACVFVPMRGLLGAVHLAAPLALGDGPTLTVPQGHPGVDGDALRAALAAGHVVAPTGVRVERIDDALEGLDLLIDLALPVSALLRTPIFRGARAGFPGVWTSFRPVTALRGSMAVLAGDNPAPASLPRELVVLAYGPDGARLAHDQAEIVRAWDAEGRPHPLPGRLRVCLGAEESSPPVSGAGVLGRRVVIERGGMRLEADL